ncbi:MAG TPA: glycine cleavage system aminomethyltransferase GcvT [Thermohalobaculum sp.]|nr:glycine cleavage system aminomethyltransferase GcvT [Thermohalobaculum sp.]
MAESESLKTTPLHALHRELGARMVRFAGYEMPLHFAAGILKEHLHTREKAGLFDVSHMGQLALRDPSGGDAAARMLERLVPVDIVGLREGRQRYALLTNGTGGILDDLMVANRGDHLFLVVNAACREADEAHLRKNLVNGCELEQLAGRALLALQGPAAAGVLEGLAPASAQMRFMDVRALEIAGAACIVSRSGYTGEDGFEISVADETAADVARALLAHEAVEPVGLGARDSLRLEAGLCLYGADLDTTTSPVEAALEWAIQAARRPGGARAGGFPGAERIFEELAHGPRRRRVGLKPEGRAPVRAGASLFQAEEDEAPIGKVTSGVFGPSAGAPVAMGYVQYDHTDPGTRLFAEVRAKRLPVEVARMPFVKPNYRRG